ncbi:MAG: metallophosphoesterase [Clostridiaceae bacterium]
MTETNNKGKLVFAWLRTPLVCAAIVLFFAGCSVSQSIGAQGGSHAAPVVAAAEDAPAFTPVPSPTPSPTPDPAMAPVTYAWISDTQGYASSFPDTFYAMTQWIVDNQAEWNIQYVLHTGDIVNDSLREKEWNVATKAMDVFVGELPVFAIAGNHDIRGMMHDYTDYTALLQRQNCQSYPTFGGEEAGGRRRYDLVTIGNDPFLLIGVGYSIMPSDVEWLDKVLSQYADRTAIVLSHHYLAIEKVPMEQDAELMRGVIARHPNVRYVLCGHMHALQRETQFFDDDGDGVPERSVQAIMADYQGFDHGGEGYIVLLTFDPKVRDIRVTAYSPIHDDYNYYDDASLETFTMPLAVVGN